MEGRCRWLQLSLRMLLLLTAAFALLLGLGNRAIKQWWLVTSLEEVGVDVAAEVSCSLEPSPSAGPVEVVHPDALVAIVHFAEAAGLSWQRFVEGDVGFRPVEFVSVINNPAFRDDSMWRLGALPELRAITLINTGVTDGAMIHLGKLTRLESLNLQDSKVTDCCLDDLKELASLRFLHLCRTAVTSAGMADLCVLKRLEVLSLTETCVGDAGLVHVGRLKELRVLNLHGTKVTDASLMHVATLNRLQQLDLSATAVTNEGVEELHKALPHCKIYQ